MEVLFKVLVKFGIFVAQPVNRFDATKDLDGANSSKAAKMQFIIQAKKGTHCCLAQQIASNTKFLRIRFRFHKFCLKQI